MSKQEEITQDIIKNNSQNNTQGETTSSIKTEFKTDKKSGWVKFDDDSGSNPKEFPQPVNSTNVKPQDERTVANTVPAVLNTESIHVNLDRSIDSSSESDRLPPVKNVEFVNTIRQGFANGDVVVTLLPVNSKWPWITPAQFRPELVPEELMAQGLTLTVEEYVHAMELLVNDVRFTLYNICYKRVLVCWITLAFLVLLALLFSGLTGLTLFSLGVVWLLFNAAAIFFCMWIKLKLSKGLEQCLGRVNKLLNKHKLILALDDRGKISCHKVNLCFIYFDSAPCVAHLQQYIEREEGTSVPVGWEQRLDVTVNDIVIQGNQSTRLSRKQGVAEQAYIRYLQRWGKDFLRRRLDWTLDEDDENPSSPRHLSQALCPCQYIEEERAALLYLRYAGRWGAYAVKGKIKLSAINPGRHSEKHNCPCQFIEDHLCCKPPPGWAKFFTLPDQRIPNNVV